MLRSPETSSSLVIRTDYSDPEEWLGLRQQVEATNADGFRANVAYWDDPALGDRYLPDLIEYVRAGIPRTFFFVVDRDTMASAEHGVLVVDLYDEPGRTFRVVPSEVWAVENNLALSNMDFADFADNVDADGVFRGFR